jgi:hypothetical protein
MSKLTKCHLTGSKTQVDMVDKLTGGQGRQVDNVNIWS